MKTPKIDVQKKSVILMYNCVTFNASKYSEHNSKMYD